MNNQLINEQVDPMTGEPVQFTTVPPTPSNELGSAKPLFNDGSKNYAQSIYGDVAQRQNSLGSNAPLFKKSCG
ncbi:unnamed protein product, partial [marine sediment metagenome]